EQLEPRERRELDRRQRRAKVHGGIGGAAAADVLADLIHGEIAILVHVVPGDLLAPETEERVAGRVVLRAAVAREHWRHAFAERENAILHRRTGELEIEAEQASVEDAVVERRLEALVPNGAEVVEDRRQSGNRRRDRARDDGVARLLVVVRELEARP